MNAAYPSLKKYSTFILEGHLNDLAKYSITKAQALNLPLLKQLAHLNEEQLIDITKRGFYEDILLPLSEEKPFYKIQESIQNWKANRTIIPNHTISSNDLIAIFNVRKQALIHLLSSYSYSHEEGITLFSEIEDYFSVCTALSLEAYEEIQENILKDNKKLLDGILNHIPVVISKVDKEGNILQSLGSGLKHLGLKEGQLVGTNLFQNYPNAENTRKAINGEKSSFPGTARGTTGEVRYYHSFFFPEEGGAIGFSVDITDQKIIEEKLKDSEYFISQITESTPIIIQVYDRINTKVIYSNKELFEMLGYTSAEIDSMGKSVASVVHPEDMPQLIERNKQLDGLNDGEVVETEMRVKHMNGQYRWINTRTTIFKRTQEGKVWQTLSTSIDITEKKESEEKIQQQLRIFDTALSNTVDFNYIFDRDGRFIYANKPLLDRLNKKLSEITGKKIEEIDYSRQLSKIHSSNIEAVINSRLPFKGESSYKSSDGKLHYFQDVFVPVFDEDENIEAIVGTTHDITELKATAEEQYKRIFESTNDAILIYDQDGNLVEINPAGYKMHEYTHDEMIGMNGKDFIHPEDHKIFQEYIAKVKEGKPYFAKLRHITKNGKELFVEKAGTNFTFHGKFHLLAVVHDITERKRSEEALKQSEEFSRSLLESSPDCVHALDIDGRVLSINPQGLKMLQIDDFQEYIGIKWIDLLNKEHEKEVLAALDKARKGEIGHFQTYSPTARGIFRWWDVLVAPIYGVDGKVDRLISVSRDVTVLKELEKEKDDFIGIASHELKTPVSVIKAYGQVLHDQLLKKNDPASADLLFKMDNQLNKLTNLIADLLDVTRIEQGNLQLRMELFDFNELVRDVTEEIQRTTQKHEFVLDLSYIQHYCGDRDRIGQVITNLLTNAVKYSPKANRIEIKTEKTQGNSLILSVRDFGNGLSPDDCKKVFERFYRVVGKEHNTYPGLGMGLYISAGIIERHKGKIWAESEPGKGSVFSFSLPLDEICT